MPSALRRRAGTTATPAFTPAMVVVAALTVDGFVLSSLVGPAGPVVSAAGSIAVL